MVSQNPNHRNSLYPSVDVSDLAEDLVPDNTSPSAPPAVADEIQWPLVKDEAAFKVDDSHYFSFRAPKECDDFDSSDDEKEKQHRRRRRKKSEEGVIEGEEEGRGSGWFCGEGFKEGGEEGNVGGEMCCLLDHLIKGILWCGDITVERLKWGNEIMKKRMGSPSQADISPETLKHIKRSKQVDSSMSPSRWRINRKLTGELVPHVYGSVPLVGSWDPSKALSMERESVSMRELSFVVPTNHETLDFKFLLKPKHTNAILIVQFDGEGTYTTKLCHCDKHFA
ncbi:Senescence/spartin-associated [Sesbania bispinosa]|nr:Senescence/spartin-associated [Sesbania bispinosa]